MLNLFRVILVGVSIAFWPIVLIWIPLELYYHQKNSDRTMFNAEDRLKKLLQKQPRLVSG